jgi:DNA-binding response OmpR family regulator
VGRTRINASNRSASFDGLDLQLTSTEFNLLLVLLNCAGTVVGKDTLSQQALGRSLSAYDRSVDVHISKIRKKLAACGGDDLIVSVRGSGYQFRASAGDV